MPNTVKRLVVFFARLGDVVMLTPFMRKLGEQGRIDMLVRPWTRDILAYEPWLGATFVLSKPHLRPWKSLLLGNHRGRLVQQLTQAGYDEIIVFTGESPVIRTWLDTWRGVTPVRVLRLPPTQPIPMHEIYLKSFIEGGFDMTGVDNHPRLTVPESARIDVRARLRALGSRIVSIQAGTSLTHRWFRRQVNLKGLQPGQWAAVIERMLSAGDCDGFVLQGSPPERREVRAIMALVPAALRARVHDWIGQVPLAEMPAFHAELYGMISVDTGPAHMAAAVGCPIVIVFGPTNPAAFLARGPGPVQAVLGRAPCQFCHETPVYRTCQDNICLRTLDPAAIHAAWRRLRPEPAAAL
jgi:heptosyltransferase-2/heptosyltransferase-3